MSEMKCVLATIALLLAVSPAVAAPLIQATWSQNLQGIAITVTGRNTDGDPELDVGSGSCTDTLAAHTQTSVTCPSGLVGTFGSATATSYNVSLTLPLFTLTTFTTGGAININTMATLAGAATISGGISSAAANVGIPGMVTVKVAGHVAKGLNASMQATGMTTLVKLPLSIGAEGTLTGYFSVLNNVHYITVAFYAWTPHTRTFTGLTSKYAALPTPTVVAMGSVNLNPGGGGVVTLVSPSKISIDGPLAQRRTASFTALRLTFLPEPSALLLLSAGAAGVALTYAHRRRMR
jgi:hypothetical protein